MLFAIAVLVLGVAASYYIQKRQWLSQAPPRPASLPDNMSSSAAHWTWSESSNGRTTVEIRAKSFQEIKDPQRFELEDVELRIYKETTDHYDLVRSAHATFRVADATLYSAGDVAITIGARSGGAEAGGLVAIHSAGVTFNVQTATATTEKPTSFTFARGEGRSAGASYDSTSGELHLKSDVQVKWHAATPGSPPMIVEAGQMIYKESNSQVLLFPWSRLTRGTLVMDAGEAVVTLGEGAIDVVDARDARGVERLPQKEIEFAARQLRLEFDEKTRIKKILGEQDAKLVSATDTSQTTVHSNRLDLQFDPSLGDSVLVNVTSVGKSVIESRPRKRGDAPLPETRILRSEVVVLKMKNQGREIDTVETHSPAQIEFLPNRRGQRKREMQAERLWVTYGAENRVESMRAVQVKTRTEPERQGGPPALTASQDMTASFDPRTGLLAAMEQWGNFTYEEGARRAKADRARLDAAKDVITLLHSARVWDDGGAVTADRIILEQATGDFLAEGNVASVRNPEKNAGPGVLSGDDPVQATAARMKSSDHHQHIRYEGEAVMWQGGSRIQADRIEIDRKNRTLVGVGNVISRFPDQSKPGEPAHSSSVFTIVKAPQMVYRDTERLAHYSGGSILVRPGLEVTAKAIRAWMSEEDPRKDQSGKRAGDSAGGRVDKVFADGDVVIVQRTAGRTRRGTGEHSEYYVPQEKIVLTGGNPLLVDSVKGQTQGQILTWYAREDRLLVDNTGSGPAVSLLKKK